MKRVSFILVSLILVLSCIFLYAVPASAAEVFGITDPSWFDYIISPSDNGLMRVDFDTSNEIYWERYLSNEVRYTNDNSSQWLDCKSSETYLDNIYFKIYPFGKETWVDMHDLLYYSPQFTLDLDIDYLDDPTVTFDMELTIQYRTYRGDGETSQTEEYGLISLPYVNGQTHYHFNLVNHELNPTFDIADPIQVIYYLRFKNLSSQSSTNIVTFDLSAESFFLLYVDEEYGGYLQALQDKNNSSNIQQGIQDTNDKLDDTNNKLDDIINSTPDPAPPEGSDDVNNVIDTEDELLDDAIGNFEDSESNLDSGESNLRFYFPALRVVVRLLNLFLAIDFFKHLSFISLSLGVLVVLLNVGHSLLDRTDASARRSAAEQRRSKNSRAGSNNRGRRRGG